MDCRTGGALGLNRTACLTWVRLHCGIALRFGCPFSFSGSFPSQFCVDSSMLSRLPFVHDFPLPDNDFRMARRRHTAYVNPLQSGLQSFILDTVTSVSSALSPRYYSWICHPLPLFASGSPRQFGFLSSLATTAVDRTGGLPWVRRTPSPYLVRLHVRSVHQISGLT